MKLEIEENPDRYTINTNRESTDDEKKELERIRQEAEVQGPIFFEMPKERLDLLTSLKKELDTLVPTLKKQMQQANYKSDPKVKSALNELRVSESVVENQLSKDSFMIDAEVRGMSAVEQHLKDPSRKEAKTLLTPEHLRYLARQLKLLKVMREMQPQAKKADKESDEAEDAAQIDMAAAIDQLVGKKMAKSIEDGEPLDVSELTYLDVDVAKQSEDWSIGHLVKHIAHLEKEAKQLEKKIDSMSLKERDEWDKHYPFSIVQHDLHRQNMMRLVETKLQMQKDIEGGASADEDEKEFAQFDPELQAWYDAEKERGISIVKKYAAEMTADGTYSNVPQEQMEAILEEVVNHENLETKELAEEFFENMWKKLEETKVKFNRPPKP